MEGSVRAAFDLNPPSLTEYEHRSADGRQLLSQMLSLPPYLVDHCTRLLGLVLDA